MGKVISTLSGTAAGLALSGLAAMKLMQTKMTINVESPKSFEDTCKAIETVIPEFSEEGWGFPFEKWNCYKVFESKDLVPKNMKNIMTYFICNAKLAVKVINANNAMMAIMPCSWTVYEKEDGNVYIAKMNMSLMSKMFTGSIKKMMIEVENTEKRMFDKIFAQ